MLIRVLLFLALPAMLIPPGICLCHIGEPAHESTDTSDGEPLPPCEDEDHDENCPAHGNGQITLVKRSLGAPCGFQVSQASQSLPMTDALPSRSIPDEHITFVSESPPLYLSLLTLRI